MNIKKIVVMASSVACYLTVFPANAALTAAQTQFFTKLYTEGLGRLPDQPSWHNALNSFSSSTCNNILLQNTAYNLLTSNEFVTNSPSAQEKAFRLYRSLFHRDASNSELATVISALNGGLAWSTLVSNSVNSSEFIGRVPTYCSGVPYGWQAVNPANVIVTNTGSATTENGLRTALANAKSGSSVYIEQGSTIFLSNTLTIPGGVTLATIGRPGTKKSPLLGRIARNAAFTGPLIEMLDNTTLSSVWVDGQRNRFGWIGGGSMNIYAHGSNVSVNNNIITDSAAWTNLQFYRPNLPCSGGYVGYNLITAYGSKHNIENNIKTWTDGLSIACKSVNIEYNSIVDATDVGIVVFETYPDAQTTQVKNNTILNAGNSAFGGIVADPLSLNNDAYLTGVPQSTILDFTGSLVDNNLIWTSPQVHLDIILSSGTRPWAGNAAYTGRGMSFTNNTSGSETITTYNALVVSGMQATTMQANSFLTTAGPSTINHYCGQRGISVAPMPYGNDINSSVQQPYVVLPLMDPLISGCMTH